MKFHQDHPDLSCERCGELYERRIIGELPCPDCPYEQLEPPDDKVSRLTFRFLEAIGGGVIREQAPPWGLILAACGIRDLETFMEVWHRAGIARHVAEAYAELKRQREPTR